MTPTISPNLYSDLVATAAEPGFTDWLAMVKATGGCAAPVHLWGSSRTVHTGTGEVLAERQPGRPLVPCGNRRRSRCPSCSETYRADTFQLIKAGLIGGKDVPETVAHHPKVFATFTAPSFGRVHQRITGPNGRPLPCHPHGARRCGRRHDADDDDLGQPLEPDSYDYAGAVLWNALATRLWSRTVQLANRKAAQLLGIPIREWAGRGRVSVAKVAEYQARGVVHFHAIFRLDGPEPEAPVPPGVDVATLCEAIRRAAEVATVARPDRGTVVWGEQIDLRPITGHSPDGEGLTDAQVAGYLAKYATKGAESSGTVDRPLACRRCQGAGRVEVSGSSSPCDGCRGEGTRRRDRELCERITRHAQRMIATCWELGGRPEYRHLRLRPWAHMLGFRGHFSTKSRRYSTTLGCLRSARQRWHDRRIRSAHHIDPTTPIVRAHCQEINGHEVPDDVVLVVGDWRYVGHGHSPGQALYAETVRQDLAESRLIWRQVRAEEAAA